MESTLCTITTSLVSILSSFCSRSFQILKNAQIYCLARLEKCLILFAVHTLSHDMILSCTTYLKILFPFSSLKVLGATPRIVNSLSCKLTVTFWCCGQKVPISLPLETAIHLFAWRFQFVCWLKSGWIQMRRGCRVSWLQRNPNMLLLFPGCCFFTTFLLLFRWIHTTEKLAWELLILHLLKRRYNLSLLLPFLWYWYWNTITYNVPKYFCSVLVPSWKLII